MKRAALIINSKAKQTNKESLKRIYAALEKMDLELSEFLEDDKRTIGEFAADAVTNNFDIVIAAGGDGTISSVASKLVGTTTALGVIPIGTYNNFAKDLGIPLEIEAAVRNLLDGVERFIDVGEVNGHHFINNSSIGLYPQLVMKRERTESRGVPRIFATAYALIQLYRRLPFHRIKVFVKGEETSHETPMLFFGNGYYDYDGLNIGERTLPIDRTLSLFILKSANRGTLFRMSIKALLNRIHNDSRFEKHFVEEAVIELQKKYIYVAKDGEIIKMESPLHYKIKPKSLRVIVPK